MAAGAGVHRRDQREAGRERERARRAGDVDVAVLERLAERLERVAAELGQLVEEEHAVVREADLARTRERPAADQPGVEMVACGARNGPGRTSPAGGCAATSEWILVTSSASPA